MRNYRIIWLLTFALIGAVMTGEAQESIIGDSILKQPAWKLKRMARQCERSMDPYSAITLYEAYLKKRPKKTKTQYQVAMLYLDIRNYQVANQQLKHLVEQQPDEFIEAWFYLGRTYKHLGKHDQAKESFDAFKDRYRGLKDRKTYRRLLKAELESFEFIDSLVNHPLPAKVSPVKSLNSAQSDAAPLFVNDSLMIYAAMSKDGLHMYSINDSLEARPRYQLYHAILRDGKWEPMGPFKSGITEAYKHLSNPVIDPNGKYLYYSVCTENWQGVLSCKIYQSRLVNDQWKRPEEMGFGINEFNSTSTQPAVGLEVKRNRTILYFVSDRPGGKGGKDIYYTRYNKRNEEWSKPRNAGSKINTVGDEETPWYDLKQGTLYFSSNGHPGIGGMDVYSAVGEKSKWSEPTILGMPINSNADDVYYRKQPRDRYHMVVSNRTGSGSVWNNTCCDDMYEIFFPGHLEMMIQLSVSEVPLDSTANKTPIIPDGVITNLYLYDPVTGEKYLISVDSVNQGFGQLEVIPGKQYLIELEKPGYFTSSKIINTKKSQINDTLDIAMQVKRIDEQPIVVPNIYFEFGSAEITEASKATIDTTLLQLMIENPTIIIEIAAHTDSKGSDELNLRLSQKRADSIIKYLREKGIVKDRLTGKGYGETMPIAPNEHPDGSDNPEGRAKNRRVDFKVIGTKLDIRSSD